MDELELAEKTRLKVQAIANGELPMPTKQAALIDGSPSEAITKFKPEVRDKILAALAGNNFMSTAVALAGLSEKMVYDWLRRGAREREAGIESDYATFSEDVERALATGEARMLKKVADSANRGDTSDAKWILERRHGARWAKKDKLEVAGDPNQPIVVQLTWPGQAQQQQSELAEPIIDAEVIDE